jgi:hypothetical protein
MSQWEIQAPHNPVIEYHIQFIGTEKDRLFLEFLKLHNLSWSERIISNWLSSTEGAQIYDYILSITEDNLIWISLICGPTKVIKLC